jgi:hypothetical protein
MQFTSAMLADAAQIQAGKLFVMGGGFDTIRARAFPATHRSLVVVMVAEISPEERQRDLTITVDLIDEDGREMGVRAQGRLRVNVPGDALPPGASNAVPLVSPFFNITFPEPKGYSFVIKHESRELSRVRFRVVQVT